MRGLDTLRRVGIFGFFSRWRRLTGFGLALVFLGVGVPYLMWRSETRGRFHAVVGVMSSELEFSRGVGPPSDESVRDRVVEIASARSVTIENLDVRHSIVEEPRRAEGSRTAPTGVAEYVIRGTLHTSHQGLEASAPLIAVLRTQFVGAP